VSAIETVLVLTTLHSHFGSRVSVLYIFMICYFLQTWQYKIVHGNIDQTLVNSLHGCWIVK